MINERVKELGRLLPNYVILRKVLERLTSGKFPELTYVGRNYTKADLIKDLEAIQRGTKI